MKTGVRIIATLAVFAVAVQGGAAFAQEFFDAPSVQVLGSRPSSVRLSIQAGDSGAPLGFAVDWMKRADFDATGWPADGDPSVHHGEFYGKPEWIVEGTAGDYRLAAGHWQAVELGELFDESGLLSTMVDELEPATEYAVRAYVLCDTSHPASPYSPTVFATTSPAAQNCTFTLGYWKNHAGAWPTASLTLGSVTYNAADLLSILNQPAGGNGLVILAHQLIAAKLNILNGADPSAANAAIATADAQIGGLVVPPVGSGTLPPSSVNATATTLDNYNNGLIGPGHCADTPAQARTWGSLKASYRH
ncbi:MAG: hypothetical protein ABI960_01955 [Candidatus Eisenbacteria bacterium]